MLKIAIQGERGSNHNLVANKLFGADTFELVCAHNFVEEMDLLESKKVDLAVMAIENSIAGSILGNYDLLNHHDFEIIGEAYLRIEHCLIGSPGQTLAQTKRVYSQEIALKQCEQFIEDYQLEAVEYYDTAASVPHALEQNKDADVAEAAGIAPAIAAEIYGGEIIARGVETNKSNYTRFVVLRRKGDAAAVPQATEGETHSETKVMLELTLPHQPGSLVKVLNLLATRKFNLTKIESRPIIGESWNYRFYIDFLTTEPPTAVTESLAELKGSVSFLRVLGSFPAGMTYEP